MSFGPALRVGVAGLKEYLDIELLLPFNAEAAMELLNKTLPSGMHVNKFSYISGKEKSLDSFISRYVYDIKNTTGLSVSDFLDKKEVPMQRNNRLFNIKDMVEDIKQLDQTTFQVTLRDLAEVKVKLAEIFSEIFGVSIEDLEVTRVDMSGWDGTGWKTPMEGEKIWAARF
jgi:radical SAM-linked protein